MPLCAQCQTISTTVIRGEAEEEGQEIYTHSVATFKQAVAENCYFCTQVQKDMPEEVRDHFYNLSSPGIRCNVTKNYSTYALDFCIPGKQLISFFRLGDYFGKPSIHAACSAI